MHLLAPRVRRALAIGSLVLTACASDDDDDVEAAAEGALATVDPRVPIAPDLNKGSANKLGELSGLAASTRHPGFVWMHRDGYAADRPSRERLYVMKVVDRKLVPFTGASGTYPTRELTFASSVAIDNVNWEDIAIGPDVISGAGSSLYVGDIGNNNGGRNNYQIYQLAEPDPTGASAVVRSLQATWRFAYPTSAQLAGGGYPNCEVLFYLDRNLYIVTKESQPRVYRFPDGFHARPGVRHTLVPVTNGATTRVVGAIGKPSYGSFSGDRKRFVLGGHGRFAVYTLAAGALRGDDLVRAMLLTPGRRPAFVHEVSNVTKPALNTEGATFEAGTHDLLLGTESKMVFHWPRANVEAP